MSGVCVSVCAPVDDRVIRYVDDHTWIGLCLKVHQCGVDEECIEWEKG